MTYGYWRPNRGLANVLFVYDAHCEVGAKLHQFARRGRDTESRQREQKPSPLTCSNILTPTGPCDHNAGGLGRAEPPSVAISIAAAFRQSISDVTSMHNAEPIQLVRLYIFISSHSFNCTCSINLLQLVVYISLRMFVFSCVMDGCLHC